MTEAQLKALPSGTPILCQGVEYDWGYMGVGGAVVYSKGERNMQDSYLVDPNNIELPTNGKPKIEEMTWQRTSGNEWVFGVPVRGLVRQMDAEVYFNEERDDPRGGWIWFVRIDGAIKKRGVAACLQDAVAYCEEALGIK